MRAVPTLHAELVAGGIRYRLDLPERDPREPLQEEYRQRLDDHTLRGLQDTADALLRSSESSSFLGDARMRGGILYRTLVPPRLREEMRSLSGPLLIVTSLYGIPWEVLHDEEEFWGLRYAVGKRLLTQRPLLQSGAPVSEGRPKALIIGADPRGDLPFVGQEIEAICDMLEEFADIDCVTGDLATFEAVTSRFGRGFDLIHYCGHVVTADDGQPGLLLAGEQRLSASAIEANVTGRPLVFLNGCASARSQGLGVTTHWEETLSGVAYGFLFAGAVGAVATLTDVSDRHAKRLAEAFYRRVLEPQPVGEALRGARAACRADPEAARSPTWLSFVLYGNPDQRLRGTDERTRVEAPRAGPEAAPRAVRGARRTWWLAAAVLFVLVLAVGVRLWPSRSAPEPGQVVVGVMEVQARSASVPDWMREITRDSLDTILSKFTQIRVYSRQKIDFLRAKRQLTEIEAAETLGMTKMISATIALDDGRAVLQVQVVDIGSGLLEGSHTVTGEQARLIELQNRLAIEALAVLRIAPTPAELQAILAHRTNETLDDYRLLRETLGGGAEDVSPEPPGPGSWLSWPTSAYAQDSQDEEAAIRALLGRYEAALEARDVELFAALQESIDERQRGALVRYFQNARDLAVTVSDVDILVEGDEAVATFTREDVFTDPVTGRQTRLEVRINSILGRGDAGWKIRGLKSGG